MLVLPHQRVSYANTMPLNIYGLSFEILNTAKVGKDQEKAQSEKDSHSKNRGGEKTKLTIRYLYHET